MTTPATSSAGFQGGSGGASSIDSLRQARVRGVTRALATHPILPPPAEVLLRDGPLQQLLADLARAGKSQHIDVLREVSEEQGVPVDELARRAQFMLACLLLPASGTFYEILDVAPGASAQEIREHWTAAIRRYHPDRFGGQNPWLDAQARRLIEAYETLRDPERRQRYDTELARRGTLPPAPVAAAGPEDRTHRRHWRRHGCHVAIPLLVIGGLGVWVWMRLAPGVVSLPPVPVPPSPRLLDAWRSEALAPPPPEAALGSRLNRDQPPGAVDTPPPPAARARALGGSSAPRQGVPAASAGPADSDHYPQDDHLAAPRPVLDPLDDSRPVPVQSGPAAAGATTGTDEVGR